jgi:SAM-dependent methyltransferase
MASPIELDANCVWRFPGHGKFDYSDGESRERHVRDVLQAASDLGSDSFELERHIRDWVSEYHLSRKRAQLLRGFAFDRANRVLEVGCGCGAITRYLGETFDDVVAVEGSLARATLARMRTRDMPNVAVLNAPFHDLTFKTRFDIIFCIGVFEYSKLFVSGPDPHETVLRHFADMLEPDGTVVIAIENQFGLKYFASSAEDHNNIMFDGLEGYPRHDTHRTFGHGELKARLSRHFREVRFYYPYPDYKLTSCVLSEEAFGKMRLGELVGKFAPRDYSKARALLFDQRLVLMELERNGMLHLFANSFLAVASKTAAQRIAFEGLGILFSDRRKREFQTVTRITERKDGSLWAEKRRLDSGAGSGGAFELNGYDERWLGSDSIQMQVLRRVKRGDLTLGELLEPCTAWMRKIRSLAVTRAGGAVLDGKYVDCLWANSFVQDGECVFIDNEWQWKGKISMNALVVRSTYYLLNEIGGVRDLNARLRGKAARPLITRIGRELGVEITRRDWKDFLRLEAEFTLAVTGGKGRWRDRFARKLRRAFSRIRGQGSGKPGG